MATEGEHDAVARARATVTAEASFGIEEGEVDTLEKKWINWSYNVEENKRLVLDEVEDTGATPQRLSVWGDGSSPRGATSRARRRTPWAERVVNASPIFYGWVVAGLVALAALVVSPAQVYSVGVMADAIIADLHLTRTGFSGIYALASLLSAPVITLLPLFLARVSRRVTVMLCGGGVCVGLLLVASTSGHLGLLFGFILTQTAGPGMLYPCAEAVLLDWWSVKRARVQAVVQAAAAALSMIFLPAVLTSCSGCAGCESEGCNCWRGAYSAMGAVLALPVALLSAMLLEGGAPDHDLAMDDEPTCGLLHAARLSQEQTEREVGSDEISALHDASADSTENLAAADEPPGSDAPIASSCGTPSRRSRLEAEPGPEPPPSPAAAETPPHGARRVGRKVRPWRHVARSRRALSQRDAPWELQDVLRHTTFWLAQVSISTVQAIVAAVLFHRAHIAVLHIPSASADSDVARIPGHTDDSHPPWRAPDGAALDSPYSMRLEAIVGALTIACSPLHLLIKRKEYLVLIALILAALGAAILANASGLNAAAMLLGCAFGVTHAYATTLWEYLYGGADAHRIKQISIAITTAASGLAIWLFAVSWEDSGSYHAALTSSALLAAFLAALDLVSLAKPETLETIVRRAPTWEQLLAFRQRTGYFSWRRRVRQRAARLGVRARVGIFGGSRSAAARKTDTPAWVEERQHWMDSTLEPAHQANPIVSASVVGGDGIEQEEESRS